jgi:hypothetical protein
MILSYSQYHSLGTSIVRGPLPPPAPQKKQICFLFNNFSNMPPKNNHYIILDPKYMVKIMEQIFVSQSDPIFKTHCGSAENP